MAVASASRQTAWFVALSLGISWTLGVLWLRYPQVWQLTQWMMVTPAIVGFACAWLFQREPPRAAGFAFTGWAPWVVALVYPVAMAAIAAGMGYLVRFATSDAGFIVFHPEQLTTADGHSRPWRIAVRLAMVLVPWLVVAFFYRWKGPSYLERLWRPLGPLASLLAWMGVVVLYPGPLAPPGSVGEELGWRGFLVRRWQHAPVTALVVAMPIWAAFHLPVIFAATQRGHVVQNVTFLASIAAAAPVFAALYRWAQSVWPCVVLHFAWNLWNPFLLGDVYHGAPGVFGGAVWFFNGEGACGLLINGLVSFWLIRRALRSA